MRIKGEILHLVTPIQTPKENTSMRYSRLDWSMHENHKIRFSYVIQFINSIAYTTSIGVKHGVEYIYRKACDMSALAEAKVGTTWVN